MRSDEIESTALTYLDAFSGDLDRALRAAVSDLLDVKDEADLRKLALDQWVSPGYVRGRAGEIVDDAIRRRGDARSRAMSEDGQATSPTT